MKLNRRRCPKCNTPALHLETLDSAVCGISHWKCPKCGHPFQVHHKVSALRG